MNTAELLQEIKHRLREVHGSRLHEVILYGSQARGDAQENSDVDVLVLLDAPVDYGRDLEANLDALYSLSLEIGRRISAKPVSAEEYETTECPLYSQVRREGIAA